MLGFPSLDLWTRFSFCGLCSEVGSTLTVLRVFTRENDIVTIGSENLFQSVHVKLSAASTSSSAACWGV